ncbi:HAD domain-containing protein [Aurantimonas coralicida]|uniref:HAD domain-containing protein n=1 Tax=Aurantimonas coralicida TaxID=182270 RepID=UPI0003F9B422|nr:HAD domain-containing protein [Aurantimonas coralicida]
MAHKKLICLDFDGVLHSYSSGWQGCDKIADGPVPGAMAFLRRLVEDGRFDVVVHSSRCSDPAGIEAIKKWLAKHIMGSAPSRIDGDFLVQDGEFDSRAIFEAIRVVDKKPPAVVTIDDRAIMFDGTWPALDRLAAFLPWNKRTGAQRRRADDRDKAASDEEIRDATLAVFGLEDQDRSHTPEEMARAILDAFLGTGGFEAFDDDRVKQSEEWLIEEAEVRLDEYTLGRTIIDGKPGWNVSSGFVVKFLPVEIATASPDAIPDFVEAIEKELSPPIADVVEDGAMYRQAFAKAEERVAARREIDRLRAVIDRAGALAAQNASAEMIRSALAEGCVADTKAEEETPTEMGWGTISVDQRRALNMMDHAVELANWAGVSMPDLDRYNRCSNALWSVVNRLRGEDEAADLLEKEVNELVKKDAA